ncbi:MAG TPA: hypothetical protein VFK12_00105 [Gammaproteobacteria bacterium]|nr:hypothetical protein [Gammaproteobacteria bacterium]
MLFKPDIVLVAILSVVCAGCSGTSLGGESVNPAPTSYPVQLHYRLLKFGDVSQSQGHAGLQVNVSIRDILPQLYYRYEIKSRVNGTYLMMPNPPKLYTVYQVPFYKYQHESPQVVVKLTFTNNTQQPIDTVSSLCAFDLDGQTVLSQPIKTPELLPGHTLVTLIDGPGFDQLQGHSAMTVWIYHLGAGPAAAPFKWVLPYQLTDQIRPAMAKLVAQSVKEADIDGFKGRIDPATNEDSP